MGCGPPRVARAPPWGSRRAACASCRLVLSFPSPLRPPAPPPPLGAPGSARPAVQGGCGPRASAAPPGAPAPPPVFSLSHRRQGSPAARLAALTAARSVFRPPGLTSPAGCAIILVRGLLTAPLGASLVESVVQDGCPVERPGSFFKSTLASNCYLMRPNATKHLYFVAFTEQQQNQRFVAFRARLSVSLKNAVTT